MMQTIIGKRGLLAALSMVMPAGGARGPAWAQSPATSPVGLWTTVDDKTGEARGVVRVFDSNGMIYGRIERVLDPKAVGQNCERCRDDRRNKPIQGLEIIRGLKPDGELHWSGGEILDPETGDTYRASMTMTDGGRKLVVRGSILGGMLGRSQTWRRADR